MVTSTINRIFVFVSRLAKSASKLEPISLTWLSSGSSTQPQRSSTPTATSPSAMRTKPVVRFIAPIFSGWNRP